MEQRLKVLISAYACEPGKGSEPEVGWQWALQMARFHDVTVLTRANNRASIEAEISRVDGAKPKFIYFDLDPFWLRLKKRFRLDRTYYVLWQRGARKLIADRLREEKFDLLHHATFAAFRYPTAVWGHGVPCIWGPVGGAESIPAALLPWRYPGPLFSELVRNLDNLFQTAAAGVLRRRGRQSNLVLVSTRTMQQAFSELGVSSRLTPTIGLHIRDFPAVPRTVTKEPLRLLYVGNLLFWKGLDLALEGLQQSGVDARFTLVGDGPFRRNLERRVSALGLNGRIEFRGRLPREQVLAAYRNFDVFLFASLHDSGGYAVIEAMSNGLPVICLGAGGPDTAVASGGGIIVPLGSRAAVVAGLAQAIRNYDQSRPQIFRDGQVARASVEAHYDWEQKGRRMNDFYVETAGKTLLGGQMAGNYNRVSV